MNGAQKKTISHLQSELKRQNELSSSSVEIIKEIMKKIEYFYHLTGGLL